MTYDPEKEIGMFRNLWKGGYLEGDPLDPAATSGYGDLGYISVLHAVYHVCVRPFIKPETVVLEIGPGRGGWTRTMLEAREIWCLDALSAEHNRFWEYVGNEQQGRVRYKQVADFSGACLPLSHFDFLFSFGVFCHISPEGQRIYLRNLFEKMKHGANAMVMFSDFDKYNTTVRNVKQFRTIRPTTRGLVRSAKFNARHLLSRLQGRLERDRFDVTLAPGKLYHTSVADTCRFLESSGWEVVNPDVGLVPRDPIIHFRKP